MSDRVVKGPKHWLYLLILRVPINVAAKKSTCNYVQCVAVNFVPQLVWLFSMYIVIRTSNKKYLFGSVIVIPSNMIRNSCIS